jgi:hypothetical protein
MVFYFTIRQKYTMEKNPIDKDKVAENPGLLPYAHTVGGFVVKPIDEGREKGLAIKSMEEQTNMQMSQIYKQMELLAAQAEKIKLRMDISQQIYQADMSFVPLIGHQYHLYQRTEQKMLLSLVAPNEWGRRGIPYQQFIATVKLLADHTWEIME